MPLLAFAATRTGKARLRDIALAHARGHLAPCLRPDGSVAQSATYDHQGRLRGQASIEGSSRDSTWARAQAWAMLGLAQAAHLAAEEFTQPAQRAAALLKLAALGEDRYRPAAEHILDALAARHLAAYGGLRDGCYEQRNGLATSNELIWGDYFLLEALLALDEVIRPATL